MATTIQVSPKLLTALKKRKMHEKESYEELLWDLLEDTMELSEETKRNIAEAEEDVRAGRLVPFDEVKRQLRMRRVHH